MSVKNTPFTEKHIALGAKMAPFAGYNMPISYTGINDEHATVACPITKAALWMTCWCIVWKKTKCTCWW